MAEWVQVASGDQDTPPPGNFLDFSQSDVWRIQLQFPVDVQDWPWSQLDGFSVAGMTLHVYMSAANTLEVEIRRS